MRGDRIGVGRGKRTGVLDTGFAAGELATDVREIGAEERAELVGRAGLRERGEYGADQVGGDHAALEGHGEEALGFGSDGGGGHRKRKGLAGELLDGGLVEAAALGVVEVLFEHLGGGLDDETGDFAADFVHHLHAVGFDGGLGLGDDFGLGGLGFGAGGFDGGFGGITGVGEDLGGFVGSGDQLGFGRLLRGSELGFGGGAVLLELLGLTDALLELAEGGLDGELVEDKGKDREVDDLDEQVRAIDAEAAEELDDGVGGVGGFGAGGGGLGGVGGEESGEEGQGEDFERRLGISAGKEKWRAPRGATPRDRLLGEEDRVERDGFGESHAQDGLDEDLAGRVGIATHGLDGLGTDETHADGGGETAGGGREGTSDFSDDHVVVLFLVFPWRAAGGLPAGHAPRKRKGQWACSSSWPPSWLQMRPM